MKTSELTGAALDWAVAKCEGRNVFIKHAPVQVMYTPQGKRSWYIYTPSTNWSQGGPIIEREAHNLFKHNGGSEWCCACNVQREGYVAIITADGPTPLIAAMRCYVASKLGDNIDLPEELK